MESTYGEQIAGGLSWGNACHLRRFGFADSSRHADNIAAGSAERLFATERGVQGRYGEPDSAFSLLSSLLHIAYAN